MRWRQAEAYEVDSDELQKYAEDLAADLKEAEGKILVPAGYFEEGSPTQSDETGTVFPTVLCGKNLKEDGEFLEEYDNELEEHNDSPTKSEGNEGRQDENGDSDEHDTDDEGVDRDDGERGLDGGTDGGDSEGSCNDEEDDL